MAAFVGIREETQTNLTGVAETPDVCMGVAEMLYVSTGVAEMTPYHNISAGTPPLLKKKRNGRITTPVKDTLVVVGSMLEISFL